MTTEEAKVFLNHNDYVANDQEAEAFLKNIKENAYDPSMGVSEELYDALKG